MHRDQDAVNQQDRLRRATDLARSFQLEKKAKEDSSNRRPYANVHLNTAARDVAIERAIPIVDQALGPVAHLDIRSRLEQIRDAECEGSGNILPILDIGKTTRLYEPVMSASLGGLVEIELSGILKQINQLLVMNLTTNFQEIKEDCITNFSKIRLKLLMAHCSG